MTGQDHDTDALVAALRSPALPAEQGGEAEAVTLMVDAHSAVVSDMLRERRSRRGVAIAAVTVASLGLGGLIAAGPGIFSPAADRPADPTLPRVPAGPIERDEADDDGSTTSPPVSTDDSVVTPSASTVTGDTDCASGNHGRTVSSTARDADPTTSASDAARSACGHVSVVPNRDPAERVGDVGAFDITDVECADGNHGHTVSSIARSEKSDSSRGEAVAAAAQSECGMPASPGAASRSDEIGRPEGTGRPEGLGRPEEEGRPEGVGRRHEPATGAANGTAGSERRDGTDRLAETGNAVSDAANAGASKNRP